MYQSPTDISGEFRALRQFPKVMKRSHWHMHLEIIYCSGSPILYEFAGQATPVGTGQIMIFWAALPHRVVKNHPGGDVYVINIPLESTFAWNLPDEMVSRIVNGAALISRAPAFYSVATFAAWYGDFNSGNPARFQIATHEIQGLLRRIGSALPAVPAPETHKAKSGSVAFGRLLPNIIGLILSEDAGTLGVNSIAEVLGMNPRYLTTYFKSHTGIPLGAYIRRTRVARARALLTDTDMSSTRIALEAGFGSLSQFYAVMKKETDLTPRQIREEASHSPDRAGDPV